MPDTNNQPNFNEIDAQSDKIRYGAPDGPRKNRRKYYDGQEPLEFLGHEAAAWFLAFPKAQRDFMSIAALAKHFNVTRVTVYRWIQDIDVMKRADSLSLQNKIAGNLAARREYVSIIEKAVEMAKEGNIKAMEFCADRAFPENKQAKKSGISSSPLPEVLERAEIEYEKHYETMTPTWLKERAARLGHVHPPVAAGESEPETKPEPGPVAVNVCDACGTTRCVHGRCPKCEACEECK
jgi:transposase